MIISFPRFRYLLLTQTTERGSPLLRYDIERSCGIESVSLTPKRRVTRQEFEALAEGLRIWQDQILNRGIPDVEYRPERELYYRVRFSCHEMFASLLYDPAFLRSIIDRRKPVVADCIAFLHRLAKLEDDPSVRTDVSELQSTWLSLVARMFSLSVPFVLADELLLRHCEQMLYATHLNGTEVSAVLDRVYISEYARDVAARLVPPLPQSKEWVANAPPVQAPILHSLDFDEEVHDLLDEATAKLTRTIDGQVLRAITAARIAYKASEETHYVLGGIVLAGNVLFGNLEWEGR